MLFLAIDKVVSVRVECDFLGTLVVESRRPSTRPEGKTVWGSWGFLGSGSHLALSAKTTQMYSLRTTALTNRSCRLLSGGFGCARENS